MTSKKKETPEEVFEQRKPAAKPRKPIKPETVEDKE